MEILWVGVNSSASEEYENDKYLSEQNYLIDTTVNQFNEFHSDGQEHEAFPNGAVMDTWNVSLDKAIDLFRTDDMAVKRLGFGIRVDSIAEGRAKLDEVRNWLRSFRITLHVSVWSWSPANKPTSVVCHAGIDEMLSLDLE